MKEVSSGFDYYLRLDRVLMISVTTILNVKNVVR